MADLNLLKVPDDPEAQYQALLAMFRKLTGREPTLEDKNTTRTDLGLPPLTE